MKTLKEIWSEFGGRSDKDDKHSYIDFYETLLAPYRHLPVRFLEIGIYTGECLLAWEQYFQLGKITGLDIVLPALASDSIKLVQGDSTSPVVCNQLFNGQQFDIIIEDGSHTVHDQVATFENYSRLVAPNGLYVVEDICCKELKVVFKNMGFEVFDRRAIKGTQDDILAVWRPKC